MPRRGWQSRRCAWLLDEGIPLGATRSNDTGIAIEDPVAEMILAQEPPEPVEGSTGFNAHGPCELDPKGTPKGVVVTNRKWPAATSNARIFKAPGMIRSVPQTNQSKRSECFHTGPKPGPPRSEAGRIHAP
jgi:hypothetical protein